MMNSSCAADTANSTPNTVFPLFKQNLIVAIVTVKIQPSQRLCNSGWPTDSFLPNILKPLDGTPSKWKEFKFVIVN